MSTLTQLGNFYDLFLQRIKLKDHALHIFPLTLLNSNM